MSFRRSLSFADDEEELLNYFDNNGKSDIAKEALKFYRENKDRVLTDSIINIIKALGFNIGNQNNNNNNNTTPVASTQKAEIQEKLKGLKK